MATSPRKAVVLLSGGMDSAVLLAAAINDKIECTAVAFHYGSKHNSYENIAAKQVAEHYTTKIHFFDLGPLMRDFKSNLLLGQGEIPEGHYEAESMKQTVVPGRNLIFLAIAAGLAESIGCGRVYIGVHRGDHHIYPDCRPEFVNAASQTIFASSDYNVALYTPFMHYSKAEIARLGKDLNVPFQFTRTCYKDQDVACGKCGSCQERLASFQEIGVEDPIQYESRVILPKE